MKVEYDKYYQTENLFGQPYPELIDFYTKFKDRGKLLDVGCGQGRDSIPLARLGFTVTGIDRSKVGIDQLNETAARENLPLKGIVQDIYSYSKFKEFDLILLDSIFHFGKREREKETILLDRLITESKFDTLITICIQKVGKKLEVLNSIIRSRNDLEIMAQTELMYKYEDKVANHSSETQYEMIIMKKKINT